MQALTHILSRLPYNNVSTHSHMGTAQQEVSTHSQSGRGGGFFGFGWAAVPKEPL